MDCLEKSRETRTIMIHRAILLDYTRFHDRQRPFIVGEPRGIDHYAKSSASSSTPLSGSDQILICIRSDFPGDSSPLPTTYSYSMSYSIYEDYQQPYCNMYPSPRPMKHRPTHALPHSSPLGHRQLGGGHSTP